MSERNRHWRESIGVLPGKPRRGGTAPAPASEAGPRARQAPPSPPVHPADVQPDGSDPLFPENETRLAPLETLVDGLPSTPGDFSPRVAEQLWPSPQPEALKALSQIIEQRHLVPRGPARSALLRSVVLRRRVELLRDSSRSLTPDADVLEARAQQWDRLAEAARELHGDLRDDSPAAPTEPVIEAGRTLAGPAELLDGEAALARNVAGLIAPPPEVGSKLAALIPEAIEIVAAFRKEALDAARLPLVEVAAGVLIVDGDLRGNDREALSRDRKLIERLLGTLDRCIEELTPEHARAPEINAWLAAWRRRVLDLRVRVDEHLTRPQGAAEEETPAAPPGAGSEAGEERALVERLRHLRGDEPEPDPPRSAGGVLGWLKRLSGR